MRQWRICAALAGAAAVATVQALGQVPDFSQAEKQFEQRCAGCHGEGGEGGDRAPAPHQQSQPAKPQRDSNSRLIKNGTPGGMPAFAFADRELQSLAAWVHSHNLSAYNTRPAGDVAAGEQFFFGSGRCSTCHMVHGRGKANGPDLSDIGLKSTVPEIVVGSRESHRANGHAHHAELSELGLLS